MAALAIWLARAPQPHEKAARRDRLALALLAGLSGLWLSSKVFSPQYLTWAMPIVLAVSGKRGRTLTWLLFATMAVTQIYLTGYYGEVIHRSVVGVGSLLVRLLLLGAFAAVALLPLATRSAPSERVDSDTARHARAPIAT
jgi:hypothetical protein